MNTTVEASISIMSNDSTLPALSKLFPPSFLSRCSPESREHRGEQRTRTENRYREEQRASSLCLGSFKYRRIRHAFFFDAAPGRGAPRGRRSLATNGGPVVENSHWSVPRPGKRSQATQPSLESAARENGNFPFDPRIDRNERQEHLDASQRVGRSRILAEISAIEARFLRFRSATKADGKRWNWITGRATIGALAFPAGTSAEWKQLGNRAGDR